MSKMGGEFKCPQKGCDYNSSKFSNFQNHINEMHVVNKTKQSGGDRTRTKKDKNGNIIEKGKHIPLKRQSILSQLLENLTKQRICPICKKFKPDEVMKEHMEKHEKFRCPTCKEYLNRFTYFVHVQKHKDEENKTIDELSPLLLQKFSTLMNGVQVGKGKVRSQYKGTRSKIMIPVPENVKKAAVYCSTLIKLGFKGGTETGFKRMKQLATKKEIPIEDLKYMRAWFSRHIYASYPTYKKWVKAGRPKTKEWHSKHGVVSWLLWSGDSGFKWANSQKNINILNKHYNKNYKSIKLPK